MWIIAASSLVKMPSWKKWYYLNILQLFFTQSRCSKQAYKYSYSHFVYSKTSAPKYVPGMQRRSHGGSIEIVIYVPQTRSLPGRRKNRITSNWNRALLTSCLATFWYCNHSYSSDVLGARINRKVKILIRIMSRRRYMCDASPLMSELIRLQVRPGLNIAGTCTKDVALFK